MNVLVYAGPEVYDYSLRSTLLSFRNLLHPNYAIQKITADPLRSDPWPTNCALLVVPTCQQTFRSSANTRVKEFVENGGKFLAFGVGANVSKNSVLSGTGSWSPFGLGGAREERPLRFSNTVNGMTIEPNSIAGGKAAASYTTLRVPSTGQVVKGISQIQTQKFIGCRQLGGLEVLAEHIGEAGGLPGDESDVMGFVADAGHGKVALWSTSPEVTAELASNEVSLAEEGRKLLLTNTLLALGLTLPAVKSTPLSITHPLPHFLTSNPLKPAIVAELAKAIRVSIDKRSEFKDEKDTFAFQPLAETVASFVQAERDKDASDTTKWQPKHVILCTKGQLPDAALTPIFDLKKYYVTLSAEKTSKDLRSPGNLGDALLYGECVTSTQSMLDQNPQLISLLPTPFVFLGSYQLAGRGRGQNVWVSPSGALQFSVLLRVDLSSFPSGKLVFVQYLFALAVTEACRDEGVLGKAGEAVRLKWPNDIYAVIGDDPGDRKKIGGILVNTNISGKKAEVIIGCGLNISNEPPLTSLAQLVHLEIPRDLSIERTAAIILAKFEPMWDAFISSGGSFEPSLELYHKRWLHSDQLVTLTTVTPPRQVRIIRITSDYGTLRTIPERTGWSTGDEDTYIDLQPDGNSFDLMANLIKLKS